MGCLPTKRPRNCAFSKLQAHRPWSCHCLCLALLAVAVCATVPSSLSAQMVIRLSIYNQVWLDGQTVYGLTTTADNSTLGGCGHSSYATQTTLITPEGTQYPSSWGGFSASVSAPFDPGEYYEVGLFQFYCSCIGNTVTAGEGTPVCIARSEGRPCTGAAAKSSTVAHADHDKTSTAYKVSSVLRVSLPATDRGRSSLQR